MLVDYARKQSNFGKETTQTLRKVKSFALGYGRAKYGLAFPEWFTDPNYTAIQYRRNLDVIFNCTYELHQFTSHPVLLGILRDLKMEYKDVLFFTTIREMFSKDFGDPDDVQLHAGG